MKRRYEYKNLDELISRAISREKPKFDFDKWKQTHRKEIEITNLKWPRDRTCVLLSRFMLGE